MSMTQNYRTDIFGREGKGLVIQFFFCLTPLKKTTVDQHLPMFRLKPET
jgi:hypothetical protein